MSQSRNSTGHPGDFHSKGETKERLSPFVSVAVRVKPSTSADDIVIWPAASHADKGYRRVCCDRGYLVEEYEFSRVFGPEDDNLRLFQRLDGTAIVDSVFSGVSETLFAYGQTGSGKTHTIFGTGAEQGMLQFFVKAVFERAAECPGSTVHVCCYEVLGDSITDLVNPSALVREGQIKREDIVWDELFLKTQKYRYKIIQVGSKSTCLSVLQGARENRSTCVSSCNSTSSRSHAVVHIFIQSPLGSSDEKVGNSSIGALTLVDLAGAEKEHENPTEQGRRSTRLLNTSLSSLNRLLRKLQTNSLDESERRQSVLNKCLWEYLRPGCGIALIFCVNPLLKHRTTSLSTLSMATASKLIQSRRKSQYVMLPFSNQACPASPRKQLHVAEVPASPAATPRARSAGAITRRARTPERHCQAKSSRQASTPRNAKATSNSSPFCLPSAGHSERQSFGFESTKRDSLQSEEAANVQLLELKNTELRRKLNKTRAKSREKLNHVTQDHQQLSTENAMLRQECETLRNLFIRQQQQQIAFWAGPFMEMILPKGGAPSPSSDLILGKLAPGGFVPSSCESFAPGDLHTTSEFIDGNDMGLQDVPPCTQNVPLKEMPAYLSAEDRLIKSVPTPLSAKRNLMNSLDATPRNQQILPSATSLANSSPPLERDVVTLDLCSASEHPMAGLKSCDSKSSNDSSEGFLPDTCGLSDTSDESTRSAFV